MQPVHIKAPEAVAELREYPADIYIVAAFGQILSQEILDIPRLGCLNIHASLLPGYRGASPIQHVIIDGRRETGITVMQMDAGLDTGDMLYKKSIPIEDDDNYETLHDKLMVLGGEAITEALALLEQGKLVPEKQDDAQSCYAPDKKGAWKAGLYKARCCLRQAYPGGDAMAQRLYVLPGQAA